MRKMSVRSKATLLAVLGSVAILKAQVDGPWMGTWKLNLSKSSYSRAWARARYGDGFQDDAGKGRLSLFGRYYTAKRQAYAFRSLRPIRWA